MDLNNSEQLYKAIKNIKKLPDWAVIRDYMLDEIAGLNSVEGLGDLSDKRAGEEAKVREKAAVRLYEIMKPILLYQERDAETEAEKVKKIKDKYGLK